MSAATDLLDEFDIITPESFGRHGYPHDEWRRLRTESPVHFHGDAEVPFWAITKHEDVTAIGRQPERFLNAPRLIVSAKFDASTAPAKRRRGNARSSSSSATSRSSSRKSARSRPTT